MFSKLEQYKIHKNDMAHSHRRLNTIKTTVCRDWNPQRTFVSNNSTDNTTAASIPNIHQTCCSM